MLNSCRKLNTKTLGYFIITIHKIQKTILYKVAISSIINKSLKYVIQVPKGIDIDVELNSAEFDLELRQDDFDIKL